MARITSKYRRRMAGNNKTGAVGKRNLFGKRRESKRKNGFCTRKKPKERKERVSAPIPSILLGADEENSNLGFLAIFNKRTITMVWIFSLPLE